MEITLTPIGILSAGLVLGIVFCGASAYCLWNRRKTLRPDGQRCSILRSVTRMLFVTTQVSALAWVFTSYGIAIYSTVRLEQVYTMAELSEPAIHTILGVGVLKVLENIFEHNEGALFGHSQDNTSHDPREDEK